MTIGGGGGIGLLPLSLPGGFSPDGGAPTPPGVLPLPPRQRGVEVNGHIFANAQSPEKEKLCHEQRLSAALGIDRARKVLSFNGEREHSLEAAATAAARRRNVPGSPNPHHSLWDSVLERQNGAPFSPLPPPTPQRCQSPPQRC